MCGYQKVKNMGIMYITFTVQIVNCPASVFGWKVDIRLLDYKNMDLCISGVFKEQKKLITCRDACRHRLKQCKKKVIH